jgi:hypothetical protein
MQANDNMKIDAEWARRTFLSVVTQFFHFPVHVKVQNF